MLTNEVYTIYRIQFLFYKTLFVGGFVVIVVVVVLVVVVFNETQHSTSFSTVMVDINLPLHVLVVQIKYNFLTW